MKLRLFLFWLSFALIATETFASSTINVLLRGADNTGKVDASKIIEACIMEGCAFGADVYIPTGTYLLARKINFNPEKKKAEPLNPETYYDWNNITIYGDGWNTVFKGTTPKASDTFNLYCVKNLHFRDFSVTNSILDFVTTTAGSNTISVVNGENITFTHIKAFGATGLEKDEWYDGGKGFTVQSNYAKDIVFSECYAYNCPSGFLMQYDNRPSTNIVINRCKAEKCQEELFLGWGLGRIRGVDHTAVNVDMDVVNCMVSYREVIAEGVKGSIRIKNTQSVKKLSKNANGKLCLKIDTLSKVRKSCYACYFYGTYYSNINVDIQARELNNIVTFDNYDSKGSFQNGKNKIHVRTNPNIRIIKNPAHKCKVEGSFLETKIYMAHVNRRHQPFRESEITFIGFNNNDVPQHMLSSGRNNRIIIGDNILIDDLNN